MIRGSMRPGGLALLVASMGGLFLLRIIMAVHVPLVPDEAYYWLWSRRLQWGYLDHPFMVAVWIRLGTALWGDTPFGVRFCGLVASCLESLFLFLAAARFFPVRRAAGWRAVLLLNATLMAGLGLVPATPDAPLLFFLSLALWALSHIVMGEERAVPGGRATIGWWLLAGGSLGLAADSKYTAFLWGLGLAGFVLTSPHRLWRQAGPWLGGAVALLVFGPTLWWNSQHQWIGLLKQGSRTTQWHPARAGQFLAELLAGQAAMLTPWVALLCGLGLWRARRQGDLLLWLCLPGALVFLLHATGDRVQPNWVWVLYPGLILAAAGYAGRIGGAVLLGQLCSALVYVQALTGALPLSAHLNPVVRLSGGWGELAGKVVREAHRAGAGAVVVDDYALASILAFQKPAGLMVLGGDGRWASLQGLSRRMLPVAVHMRDAHYGPVPAGAWVLWRRDHGQFVRVYRLELRRDVSAWQIW